jgi:hypothetical protein
VSLSPWLALWTLRRQRVSPAEIVVIGNIVMLCVRVVGGLPDAIRR